MRLERTVVTDKPLARVFDYLSDFTSTTDEMTYTAEFTFKGAARYVVPLFRPVLARL